MKTVTHSASKWLLARRNSALLFGLILAICTSVFGEVPPVEQWVARYNGPVDNNDYASALAVDSSGNVYVTGRDYGSGTGYDYATVKYDQSGNQIWVAHYNGPGNGTDGASALTVDSSGNVYVTGNSTGSGTNSDYATVKYSPDGNQLWVARYNGPGNSVDSASALAVDSSGNVYVTGRDYGSGTGFDYATIKYSPDGNQLWVAHYNGDANGHEYLNTNALAVDGSGNVYVTGYSSGGSTSMDYATIRYDTNGNQLWVKRYNGDGNGNDYVYALTIDSSRNVYVTGESAGSSTSSDYATIKYDTNGNQLWVRRYNGDGNYVDVAYAMAVDSTGNVYVTGKSWGSGTTNYGYATVKYAPNGDQLWATRYNDNGPSNYAYAMAVDSSRNVYVTGYSYNSGTNFDYATVKYDTNGNQLWVVRYNNGPGGGNEYARDLTIDGSGNVYVTGYSDGSGTGYDYATIKYTQRIYVDANATGANNGSSWEDAYNYLQDALTAAESNYEIWVAQGTYRPDEDSNEPNGTDDRYATFQLISDVAIYGGFPSGGGTWTSRDPNTYETILSGDLNEDDEPNFVNNGENSYHVVTGSGTNSIAILDGFTITAGNANYGEWPNNSGGGMFSTDANCTVNNCTFVENFSGNIGGAMWNSQSNVNVSNCVFFGNAAELGGGGIAFYQSNHPVVVNCSFISNKAFGAGNNAGGLYNIQSNTEMINCSFINNSAQYGGAVSNINSSSPTLTNCTFIGNSATDFSGGMNNWNGGNQTLTNCTFSGNSANYGGGMSVESNCCATLTDCNFSGNSAQTGSGIYAISNSVTNVKAGGSVSTVDEFYISQNSRIKGTGSVVIGLGGGMVVVDNAVVDMNDPDYPNVTGTIQCDGLLKVKDNAKLNHAKLQVTRQGGGFFGKFRAEGSTQVKDVNIYADGDRFMDVDPCTFTGLIANNRIYVTITEGQNQTPEGVLELRGRDLSGPNCFDDPNVLACHLDSNAMPPFDTNSWTLERLEVAAGARVNLTDRFSSGNGDHEVLYVKELVLGNGCVLNVGFERLYYMNRIGEANSIKKGAVLGFSLGKMDFDSSGEFKSRVGNNNFTHPTDPNCNRIYVERVEGPNQNGMVKMHNLADPYSGQIISARAKEEFGPAVEDEIRIRFNYKFDTNDPCAQIVVYLSDVNGLLETRDPNHYIEVARISNPPGPRPGSANSVQFGNFDMLVLTGGLDLSKGTWIELELVEPRAGQSLARGYDKRVQLMDSGEEGASVSVDDSDAGVYCQWGYCLDLNYSNGVDEADFLVVVSGAGSTDPPSCVDGSFSADGYLDAYDTTSWDWTLNDLDDRQNLCGQMPLSGGVGFAAGGFGAFGGPLNLLNPSDLNDLLIAGKRRTYDGPTKLKDRLYVFDSNYHYIKSLNPASDRCNIRTVRGVNDDLYQINSEKGVLLLDEAGTKIVSPGKVICDTNEPRYNRSATVCVGIQGSSNNPSGRPILDAAFDANFVYVVPVVVEPNGNEPNAYAAAAKLALDYNSTPPLYHVVKLYDGPVLPGDNQLQYRNTLREIELDDAGNVYVTNANIKNESDILWKFEPNGAVHRLNLDPIEPCYAPTGMCVSSATNVLYLASSIYNKADPCLSVIYGFSTDTLALVRTIMVSGMQHVTSITEDPITHSLWVAGFNFEFMPPPGRFDIGTYYTYDVLPFYDPYLAWVPLEVNSVSNVSAVCILDASHPDYDLAMPLSIVWTGAQPQKKCGGADIDDSNAVDMQDFAWLARYWRTKCADSDNYSYCERADLKPDGYIDLKDLDVLVEHWLEPNCL